MCIEGGLRAALFGEPYDLPKNRTMRRSFVAFSLVTTVFLAACGSTGTTAHGPTVDVRDPVHLVAATADATAKAKTARMAMTVSVSGDGLPQSVTLDMDGAMAFDGSRADFTMNLGSLIPTAGANAAVEIRLVDGAMYMDMASFLKALSSAADGLDLGSLLGDAKWLKVDAGQLGSANSPAQYTQYLEYLRGVSNGGVTTVGHDTIRGVDTTHYRADIDVAKAIAAERERLAKMSPMMRQLMEKDLDALAASDAPMHADVWIDDHDMVRRFKMDMPALKVPVSGRTVEESVSAQIDLYDFGTPVDVQAPPPSEVRDLSQLLNGALGSLGGVSGLGGTGVTPKI